MLSAANWLICLLAGKLNFSLHVIWGSATESQNGWVWKWPLQDYLAQIRAPAGPPRADCPGSCPGGFLISLRGKTLQPSWAMCVPLVTLTVKKCFLKLRWSLLYFSLCPLPSVLSGKGDGIGCRESAMWKPIRAFHSSFQLQCVAQDHPSQNLGLISGKERCKCCSWSVFSWWHKMYQSPLDAGLGVCHVSYTKGVKYYLQSTWQGIFCQNLAFKLISLSKKVSHAVRL